MHQAMGVHAEVLGHTEVLTLCDGAACCIQITKSADTSVCLVDFSCIRAPSLPDILCSQSRMSPLA